MIVNKKPGIEPLTIVILGCELTIDRVQVKEFVKKHQAKSIWFAIDCGGDLYMFTQQPKPQLTAWDIPKHDALHYHLMGSTEFLANFNITWTKPGEWHEAIAEYKPC